MHITQKKYPKASYYVEQWKLAKTYAADSPSLSVTVGGWLSSTAGREHRKFLLAMHRRINQRGGINQDCRRMLDEYQTNLKRDRQDLHNKLTRRIRVYQFRTDIMRKRFGHLLDSHHATL